MVKNLPANLRDLRAVGATRGLGRYPGGGHGQLTLVFLPGKSHGQRNLAGCSLSGHRELNTTEVS